MKGVKKLPAYVVVDERCDYVSAHKTYEEAIANAGDMIPDHGVCTVLIAKVIGIAKRPVPPAVIIPV